MFSQFIQLIDLRCVPKCSGCKNGECLSPNVCQCKSGYDWDEECKPRCSNCTNGICAAPATCVCNNGYVKHNSLDLCIPHCKNKCLNGKCVAPNMCVCDTGYRAGNDSLNMCQPICEIECINGQCVEPNVCECHENYVARGVNRSHDCHCGNYCAEVDKKCHCLDKSQRVRDFHRLFGNDTAGNCSKNACKNGYCVTTDDCECFDGFIKNQNNTCVLLNETCIDETIEDCALGNGTRPEPSRNTVLCSCINGVCSLENKCICIGGYKMSNVTTDKCIPHCSKDCVSYFQCNNLFMLSFYYTTIPNCFTLT